MVGDDGVIVFNLHGQWTCDDPDAMVLLENSLMVRVVKKSSAGDVCVYFLSVIHTAEDLKKMDVYSDLVSMP